MIAWVVISWSCASIAFCGLWVAMREITKRQGVSVRLP